MLVLLAVPSALLMPSAAVQPQSIAAVASVTAVATAPQQSQLSAVFPMGLIADNDPPISKEKARIEAAKAAADAKLAQRGMTAPQATEVKTSSIDFGGKGEKMSKYDKLIAEARDLKQKRLALSDSGKKLSKSQSALAAQYRTMEKQAMAKAQEAKEIEAELALKASQPPPSLSDFLPF